MLKKIIINSQNDLIAYFQDSSLRMKKNSVITFQNNLKLGSNILFEGKINLGKNNIIGPNCLLNNVAIGNNNAIKMSSLIENSKINNQNIIGPFAYIRDKTEIKNRIEEVLSSLGVAEIASKYAFQISGGEQQRVAIARALLNAPELIIADEPTGNLDPQTSLEIMEIFRGLHQQGMTIIMATHDYNMIVKFPGKILRCDDGKIYEVVQKNEA